jgi:hypothetical protein
MAAAMSNPPRTANSKAYHAGPFAELRLTKGVKNATDDQLAISVESCERAAIWGGLAVIAGLVVEVVLAIHQASTPLSFDSFEGTWGAVIADSLVALGVSAEVFFSRVGMSRQRELQRRSDRKLADAIERAAEANERAAKLEKEAAEAHLQIERLRTRVGPRFVDRSFAEALEGKPKASMVTLLYSEAATDGQMLARQLKETLESVGWRVSPRIESRNTNDTIFQKGPALAWRSRSASVMILRPVGVQTDEEKEICDGLLEAISRCLGASGYVAFDGVPFGSLWIVIYPKV